MAKTFQIMHANTVAFMNLIVWSCVIYAKNGSVMAEEIHLAATLSIIW